MHATEIGAEGALAGLMAMGPCVCFDHARTTQPKVNQKAERQEKYYRNIDSSMI